MVFQDSSEMNCLNRHAIKVESATEHLQNSLEQQEVKQEMDSYEEQLGCNQWSKMSADAKSINVSEGSQTDEKLFGCGKCLTYFKESDMAKACFYSHKKVTCDMTHFKVAADSKSKSDYSHTVKSLLCNVSGNSLTVSGNTCKLQFICPVCNNRFSRSRDLGRHMCTHTDERPFKCEVCATAFSQHVYLKKHMRTHIRPYKCEVCGTTFNQRHHLQSHILIHTGERPFKCQLCSAAFCRQAQLNIHVTTHTHRDEWPFICQVCDKKFSHRRRLKRHMTSHTHKDNGLFICQICDKNLGSNSSLTRHIRTHSGERPFKCEVCDAVFTERYSLKKHLRNICTSTLANDLLNVKFVMQSSVNVTL